MFWVKKHIIKLILSLTFWDHQCLDIMKKCLLICVGKQLKAQNLWMEMKNSEYYFANGLIWNFLELLWQILALAWIIILEIIFYSHTCLWPRCLAISATIGSMYFSSCIYLVTSSRISAFPIKNKIPHISINVKSNFKADRVKVKFPGVPRGRSWDQWKFKRTLW